MNDSKQELPTLARLINQKLLNWSGLLFITATLCLGTFFYIKERQFFEATSGALSLNLAGYVDNYISSALSTLNHIGLETEHARATPGENVQATLKRTWEANRQFARLLLIAPDRTVMASAPTGMSNIDFPIPLETITSKGHHIGHPLLLEDGSTTVVYLAHSLPDGSRIVGALKLDAIQDHIRQLQPQDTSDIILTDQWGTVLAHPDSTAMRQQENLGYLPFFSEGELLNKSRIIRMHGECYLASSTAIRNLSWMLITAMPMQDVYLSISMSVAQFLLFLFIIFAFVSLSLAVELKKALLIPFRQLDSSISKLAKGAYGDESDYTETIEELNALHRNFKEMAAEVQLREKEIADARHYVQNILDSMPSVIIGMDGDFVITHINKATEQFFGIHEQEVVGRRFQTMFPSLADYDKVITSSLAEGSPRRLEKQSRRNNEGTFYFDILLYPLSSGGRQGVVLRMEDTTRRVRLEEMMVQTEKMMSVGGLAAGMAHEINNPLGAILQGAQNIERRISADIQANKDAADKVGCRLEQIRDYLAERQVLFFLQGIRQAGSRAAQIVSNMLDFSRASDARRSTVDLNASLDRTVELAANDYDLKKRYDFRSIVITRDYEPELPAVICSTNEIEQVVLNLLRNAAQAMHAKHYGSEEHPEITIRTRSEPDFVRIEVKDNGPGMPDTIRKRVFEPFFTTKEIGVGTGLGLSVSYFIITENHGGTFDVISTPDVGSTFTIRLPRQKESA
ncbi:PAS domain-containing protein [Desulfovibrio subterraneus]|uniref:sensor histidine kinase n=1 Tax=Desulfovibrio subterraneus TaxID=2718620 RepID=UPI0022B92BB3|nr:PAS domain-containing sensor histidine kinase [Desulfovibrio subterraneus]WBF67034.1 PAS domain-containing protein [Desulfovibrio subterraneus]